MKSVVYTNPQLVYTFSCLSFLYEYAKINSDYTLD